MLKFNLSPSSLNQYKESPLVFFYNYVKKAYPDTEVPDAYGRAGSLVHHILELYIKQSMEGKLFNPLEMFEEQWKKQDIDNAGVLGCPLDKSDYMKSLRVGIELLQNKYDIRDTEEKLMFPLINDVQADINMKGIIDCQGVLKNTQQRIILDWKTSSSIDEGDAFKRQGLFYVCLDFLRFKEKHPGVPYDIPLVIFEYIKIGKTKSFNFNISEINAFLLALRNIAEEIVEKGFLIDNYDIGDIDSPFNAHKKKCLKEIERRQKLVKAKEERCITFNLRIIGNKIQIRNKLSPLMMKVLKKQFSYEVQNVHFIRKNSNWDGIQRLFNERSQTVGLGFRDRLYEIFHHYAKKMGYEYKIEVEDTRMTKPIMLDDFPKKLHGIELRDYQSYAVEEFIENRIGILELATGAGKTIIALELIRRLKLRTLFIINRKELMYQTRDRMKEAFGIDIGVIGDGQMDTDKWVTVSTVQTLVKRKDELKQFFKNIQFAICDETHIVASKSFRQVFTMLVNTLYRCGLSGTAFRDDGNDMLIEEGVGQVVFKLDAKQLVDEGRLMRPTIYFEHVHGVDDGVHEYSDDYTENIVENEKRNDRIVKIVEDNMDKKILILTKQVEHGSILTDMIAKSRDVFHLHGSVPAKERKEQYDVFKKSRIGVLVATVSIASEGLDIPDLDIIINASANKGDVKSIQILGRVLRNFEGKEHAIYWDFFDRGKYTRHHSRARYKAFKSQGYEISSLEDESEQFFEEV